MAFVQSSPRRPYRTAKPLPYQLRNHCAVYFEEKLCKRDTTSLLFTQLIYADSHALSLLLSLLSSGSSSCSAAFVPPPQHIALAATIIVHPSITTRAKSRDLQQVANAALQLLRLTNAQVGPVSARLDLAFSFTHFDTSRHGGRRLADNEDVEPLNLDIAKTGSVWARAEDFWAVVGWAFNCAVLHRKRWERWRLWLEFMCDVLEDDWSERLRMYEDEHGPLTRETVDGEHLDVLKESLIVRYIGVNGGVKAISNSNRDRRIMRAIFADGSATATNEFREVFYNELKELNVEKVRPRKRQGDVNIEEDEFADYLMQDESEEPDEGANPVKTETGEIKHEGRQIRSKRLRTRAPNDRDNLPGDLDSALDGGQVDNLTALGDLHAITLRRRLLHLLSDVSYAIPQTFTPLPELYGLFVDFMRHLPLPIFQLLVSPSVSSGFSAAALTTLCETLLRRLLESSAPDSDEDYLSQEKLVTCYLPYAARTTSPVDNAKVSILLESLMRLLQADGDGLLAYTDALKLAAEGGILSRAEKAQTDTRKSQMKLRAEEIGWNWLIESGERIAYLVEMLAAIQPAKKEEDIPVREAVSMQTGHSGLEGDDAGMKVDRDSETAIEVID